MKQYSEYKDSGVKWIGEIPSHWKTVRLKRTVNLVNEKSTGNDIPYIALENIESYTGRLLPLSDIEPDSTCNSFKIDDVLFCKLRPYLTKCVLAPYDGKCTSELLVLRNFSGDNDFLHYILLSPNLVADINASTYGSKMPRANWNYIGSCAIPFPSLSEQRAIVSYLDNKVSKIDTYISTAEKKIAALDELKQVTIADAVTHGINPNVPMKDSGIPWIGMVPEHWKLTRIKFLFNEISEKEHPEEPCLCSTQKYGVIPQSMYENRVVVVNKGLENLKFVRKGNFVISLRSFQGGIEIAYYQGIISAAYTILSLGNKNISSNYIKYLFKSSPFIQLLQTCVTGIREGQNINYELLRRQFIPIPTLSQQNEIVAYIDRKVAQIDKMKAAELAQIDKLKEYKQRLISDVVTGKVKVTND